MVEKLLELYSFNARGLSNELKRVSIFQWLKSKHNGIVFLQETHSTKSLENSWSRDWSGDIYYSHGSASACGVAILIPAELNTSITEIKTDNDGRILLLDIEIDDNKSILCNVYAPTRDKVKQQHDFIQKLNDMLSEYVDANIILGGDFNTYLNADLDKKGPVTTQNSSYTNEIKDTLTNYNLIDIWRNINPTTKRYTWRGMSKAGQIHSRLDYFFISIHMTYDFDKANILPSIKSDHSLLRISFKLQNTINKGKGFWKLNTSLLRDRQYVEIINRLIEECTTKYNNIENKSLVWDIIKCEIRGQTISYAAHKAKENRKREEQLHNRLQQIEEELDTTDNTTTTYKSIRNEYDNIKSEIEDLNEYKAMGHLIRSKAQWVEHGEKCSKYFLQLENRNYKTKYIKSIFVNDNLITNPKDILDEQAKFYRNLYSNNQINKSMPVLNAVTCSKLRDLN